jgi:AbiTii-like protein
VFRRALARRTSRSSGPARATNAAAARAQVRREAEQATRAVGKGVPNQSEAPGLGVQKIAMWRALAKATEQLQRQAADPIRCFVIAFLYRVGPLMSPNPGLVEQLQAAAMDSGVPITDLLRKAKATAVKLKQDDFLEWLEHEISGYPRNVPLPAYRKLPISVKFLNPVLGRWCPVVGSERQSEFPGSIAEISSLLASDTTYFTSPVSREAAKHVIDEIEFVTDVHQHINRTSLETIVESVRDAIHDWALKLESAGVHGEGLSFSQTEKQKAQSVVINIGSIGTAAGIGSIGDYSSITATQNLGGAELAEQVRQLVENLERALPGSQMPDALQAEVKRRTAELKLLTTSQQPDEDKLRKALGSLKVVMESAAGNLVAGGVAALIQKLLS